MGLFDTFIKSEDDQPRSKSSKSERLFGSEYTAPQSASVTPETQPLLPVPVKPKSFEDVYALLDKLKLGQAVAVDCSELKEATAIRVLDILSGAAYALNGGWRTYGSEIFLFAFNNTFNVI